MHLELSLKVVCLLLKSLEFIFDCVIDTTFFLSALFIAQQSLCSHFRAVLVIHKSAMSHEFCLF